MADPRALTNPIFNSNKLKLGLFGLNGPGVANTTVPELFDPTWANISAVAKLADRVGIEALVSYSRWQMSGEGGGRGRSFEPVSWAAALCAITNYSAVMATELVHAYHPTLAAKAAATIDQISGGRFAINVVAGFLQGEMDMFGQPVREHGDRYDSADEWLGIVKRLWAENEAVEFRGRHYNLSNARIQPKPVQPGGPAIMNAGGSERGSRFAAKNADLAFTFFTEDAPEAMRAQVDNFKRLAREEYGRSIQVWINAYVVQRDTVAEAERYVDYYLHEHGDHKTTELYMKQNAANARTKLHSDMARRRSAQATAGGFPLVGNTEDIAAAMQKVSDCGVDGVLLSWIDYRSGLKLFAQTVIPELERRGLRAPFHPRP